MSQNIIYTSMLARLSLQNNLSPTGVTKEVIFIFIHKENIYLLHIESEH